MPKKSQYNYIQVKDIAFKAIQAKGKVPILFRQLQFQSILIFMPSGYHPNIIKNLLNEYKTNWHFIIVSDDAVYKMAKNDKLKSKSNGSNNNQH